jgi:hypothetical protein
MEWGFSNWQPSFLEQGWNTLFLYRVAGARVAQSLYCQTMDWAIGVRSLTETEDIYSSLCVQTGSGAHPASYTVGTRGPFPGGKVRPGRDADHSPPSSTEVKNE